VLATPFTADATRVDEESLRREVAYLLGRGVAGLVVLGVFGEAARLSAAERVQVARLEHDGAPGTSSASPNWTPRTRSAAPNKKPAFATPSITDSQTGIHSCRHSCLHLGNHSSRTVRRAMNPLAPHCLNL
jgi:hypothetical protein